MTKLPPSMTIPGPGVQTARVEAIEPDGSVRIRANEDGDAVRATIAFAGSWEPSVGDAVLVACDVEDNRYVLAPLVARPHPAVIEAGDGVRARLDRAAAQPVLRVEDAEGRTLFEYRPAERRTIVAALTGDLELHAPEGSIRLVARDRVEVKATEAEVKVTTAKMVAKTVHTIADRMKSAIGVMETTAERILERAKDTYREVQGLAQTRAGRVRTVAKTTVHTSGERVLIKADQDVKVKGEKIFLA